MAGLRDFLFGKGPLEKAAAPASKPTTPPAKYEPAGLDIAKMAQDQADKSSTKPPATTLSSPMTPVNKKGSK